MDISYVTRCSTSDIFLLKETFALSLKPLKFAPVLILRAKLIAVPPIFPTDIPFGPSKRTVHYLVLYI